jgi:hypothetical protein
MPEAPDEPPVPEIAFMTFDCANSYQNAVLRVISGTAPHRLLWSSNGSAMPNTAGTSTLRWDGHIAIGELDGNAGNGLEIVAVRSGGTFGLVAFHGDGSRYWISSGMSNIGGANPSVNIADLNQDGVPEVIAGASAFNGRTGALLWQGTGATGVNGQGPLSVVANLDDDNTLEVIAGGTVYESDGRVRFGAMGQGFAAVGDMLTAANVSGHDGVAEIVRVIAGRVEILDRRTGGRALDAGDPDDDARRRAHDRGLRRRRRERGRRRGRRALRGDRPGLHGDGRGLPGARGSAGPS